MKKLVKITAVLFLLALGAYAQAKLPSNCAQDITKLEELVKSARHLPENMHKLMLGKWHGKKFGAKVDIEMTKKKSGRLMMELHVVSKFLGIDQKDKAPVAFCVSNSRAIDVYAKLFGKNEHQKIEVLNPTKFKILNGRIKGQYNKKN